VRELNRNECIIGIDIGGTKCAVVLGNTNPEILERIEFPTNSESGPDQTIKNIENAIQNIINKPEYSSIKKIGISCGGPLDSKKGIILSPPNLPGWDNIPIVSIVEKKFGIAVALQNDANACALAEWKWGAGRGVRNMIFLTFGTGLGAGLILNGKLYSGTNDMAGEVGHIRLESGGPVGYGKKGSFEGFCSGGGIAQLAKDVLVSWKGSDTKFTEEFSGGKLVNARDVCEAASKGDPAAKAILVESGGKLGMGLSVLIDILNPERIVIGSIFARCREHLWPTAEAVIQREALGFSQRVCSVIPASLGEKIGDYASLSVAINDLDC